MDDLEIRCKVCNNLHCLMMKNPFEAVHFTVSWNKDDQDNDEKRESGTEN